MRYSYFIVLTLNCAFLNIAHASIICVDAIKGYQALAPTKPVAIEAQLKDEPKNFFAQNPGAERGLTDALYGIGREGVNPFIVSLIDAFPEPRRKSAVYSAVIRMNNRHPQEFRADDFTELLTLTAFREGLGEKLFDLPIYRGYQLQALLKAAKLERWNVQTFEGGRGDFAYFTSPDRKIVRAFKINPQSREAAPIFLDEFAQIFEARARVLRAFPRSGVDRVMQAFGFGTRLNGDQVGRYANLLSPEMREQWLYITDALSDESYFMLQVLLRKRIVGWEKYLRVQSVGAPVAYSGVRQLTKAIWKAAADQGYRPRLDDAFYAEAELDSILDAYSIVRSYHIDSLMVRYRKQDSHFLRDRGANGQRIYRSIGQAEYDAYEAELRRPAPAGPRTDFGQSNAIIPAILIDQIPDHIVKIPHDLLRELNLSLNANPSSRDGYKQPNEDFSQLIKRDTENVVRLGYTPKQLAEWLRQVLKLIDANQTLIEIDGVKFEVVCARAPRPGQEPFRDTSSFSKDYILWNRANGQRIHFINTQAFMIGFFGFFGGDPSDRLPPEELIGFMEGKPEIWTEGGEK